MKKRNSKRGVILTHLFVWVIIVIGVFGVLWSFGLISGSLEIEKPRNDVSFSVKSMASENLPMVKRSKEEFRKINLGNEERLVFLDGSDFQADLRIIKVWMIADGNIYYYQEELKEGYPLLTSISDIDIKFRPNNRMCLTLWK